MTPKKPIQKLVEKTDKASRKWRDNPHSKELAEEYVKAKEELKESVVSMREALEAIRSEQK
ncbi:hypothetical protein KIH87_05990 [Paraneptunicella aestuarii]|uniref:hypothetical protein n=1 Tax=Paraneptunicella aestuarii TaxID=2831148 RepID=UPI001E509F34|nr:hypothetical protein [Paraneptunicella aestuarii]UAA39902.1 hypothetical protein KIH87_05990 [Paraneptunicella aestuarii]